MDKKFLDKVIDIIVNETIIDYDKETISTPLPLISPNAFARYLFTPRSPIFWVQPSPFISFIKHCRDVYGLNDDEVNYVWVRWRDTIKYKKDNGL
tara:strand:+ start:68 stop:352 length:285 start_codon:yes stop_codon:yes gene_type:complete